MTWGRGLFRIWIVFSALWLTVVLLMGLDQTNVSALLGGSKLRTNISVEDLDVTKPRDGTLIVSAENGSSFEFETGGVVEDMADDWQRMLEAAVERLNAQNEVLNMALHRIARAKLSSALQFGLLPPLCLLALGWSVLWALRGFRGDAN